MSLGRLLAAGKSLVGGQDRSGRYRVNKGVALPKFISPRNPFAAAPAPDATAPVADAPTQGRAETPAVTSAKAVRRADGEGQSRLSIGDRAVRWLGEWGRRLKPLPRATKPPGPARSAVTVATRSPVQAELSLDQVKVVRNDLSDGDLEVVPVKAPMASARLVSDEKFALVGNSWGRLSTKIFGARPT